MAKQVDDWLVWSGGKTGKASRAGSFVQICPSGGMLISKELADKLDRKRPNATLRYSLIRKQLRIDTQTEIVAGSLRWLTAKTDCGRVNAASALKTWLILPEKTTLYLAEFVPASDESPAHILVHLSRIIETIDSPKPKGPIEAGSDTKAHARVGKCPECGRVVGVEYKGETKLLKPHDDPSGIACLCRRPEK